jgi:hypothetical protein
VRFLTLAPVVMVVDDEFWQLSGTALLGSRTCASVSTKVEGPCFFNTPPIWLCVVGGVVFSLLQLWVCSRECMVVGDSDAGCVTIGVCSTFWVEY